MAAGTAVDAGAPGGVPARGGPPRWWPVLPAALDAVAGAAFVLPWWRAGVGPVLLGTGPLQALAPDVWTGTEVTGARAVGATALAVVAVVAAAVAVVAVARRPGARIALAAQVSAVAAGAAAPAGPVAALRSWGPPAAPGVWLALLGLAGAGTGLRPVRARRARLLLAVVVLAAALLAAAATVALPAGPAPPHRGPDGP